MYFDRCFIFKNVWNQINDLYAWDKEKLKFNFKNSVAKQISSRNCATNMGTFRNLFKLMALKFVDHMGDVEICRSYEWH